MYNDLLQRLEKCVQQKKLNTSSAREKVLRIFSETSGCVSSEEIYRLVNENYPKKISHNTVYRIVRLFMECGLIVAVPTGQKKTLYCIEKKGKYPVCALCPECDTAELINLPKEMRDYLSNGQDLSIIVIYKKCKDCR